MASTTFTLKRSGPITQGDAIVYEAVSPADGTIYGGAFIYNDGWGVYSGASVTVSDIDDNTISVTLTLANIGILASPKMLYLPSPYNR